jgi:dephospho-CoA kinase
VDRAAVAARAFATDADRAWLEGVIWPRVAERIAAFCKAGHAADPPPRALVVETPLLFEAEMDALYDATIAVIAAEELRAERAAGRGHAALDERTARQLTQEEKAARATYTVVNDGSPDDLERSLSEVLVKLEG